VNDHAIEIREAPIDSVGELAVVPISFTVTRPGSTPWVKNYDDIPGVGPREWAGYGDHFDESLLKPLPAGSVWTEPGKVPHFAWTKDGDVMFKRPALVPLRTFQSSRDNERCSEARSLCRRRG